MMATQPTQLKQTHNARLIGIGNAAMDLVSVVPSDADIARLGLKKGHCVFLSDAEAEALTAAIEAWGIDYVPGGSAANVLSCFAALGGGGRFVGKTAPDESGRRFSESMTQWGIAYDTVPTDNQCGSTRIFTIVTPDGERSFAASYGASHAIAESDLRADDMRDSAMLLIDGYMLMSDNGPNVLRHAIAMAQDMARPVVFLPADLSVIEAKPDDTEFLMQAANAVICNAEQAIALTGAGGVDEAVDMFRQRNLFGCVTLGAEGVLAFEAAAIHRVENPYQPDMIVSTNGAGDNFSGGFLYGLLHGMGMVQACRLGMYCALEILKHQSPRPQTSLAHLIESV